MLVLKSDDVPKLHKALMDLQGPKGLPFVVQKSLNASAIGTKNEWAAEGKRTMTVRNKWTFNKRNHQARFARLRKNVNQMESVAGNKLPYMAKQEKGFYKTRLGGLQIPEDRARIGGDVKRVVTRAYWRKKIGKNIGPRYNISDAKISGNPKRLVATTLREARKRGKRYVYIEFSSTARGIYDVSKLKRRKTKLKEALIWDMGRRMTHTKPNPMLQRTLKTLQPHFMDYHRDALEKQIRYVLVRKGFRVRGPSMLTEYARFKAK